MKNQFYTGANYTEDLKSRMEKAGITSAALSAKSGIDPSQFSRWFNTDMQPSLANVQRIEKAFAKLVSK
jgi:transcriptional regulator with XRE-family HTH domain